SGLLQYLYDEIPQAAACGVVLPPDGEGLVQLEEVTAPYFISHAPVGLYATAGPSRNGVFIASWQDEEATNRVTFDGLLDTDGRHKPDWHRLYAIWKGGRVKDSIPQVSILRPAMAAREGKTLEYRALLRENGNWQYAGDGEIAFEWSLVRLDRQGKTIRRSKLGTGAVIRVEIPFNPASYRLQVSAARGGEVSVAMSTLNTPL
ncbi:hypothetical protein, partial [Chitinophaga sp.]|uniref:hypothetical protein n=1 Tax=Chitinophaga sp. TaxID=1869181 RepID=UPI0026364487